MIIFTKTNSTKKVKLIKTTINFNKWSKKVVLSLQKIVIINFKNSTFRTHLIQLKTLLQGFVLIKKIQMNSQKFFIKKMYKQERMSNRVED